MSTWTLWWSKLQVWKTCKCTSDIETACLPQSTWPENNSLPSEQTARQKIVPDVRALQHCICCKANAKQLTNDQPSSTKRKAIAAGLIVLNLSIQALNSATPAAQNLTQPF